MNEHKGFMERLAACGGIVGKCEASEEKQLKAKRHFTFIMVLMFTVPFHFIRLVCNSLVSLTQASFSTVVSAGKKSWIFK